MSCILVEDIDVTVMPFEEGNALLTAYGLGRICYCQIHLSSIKAFKPDLDDLTELPSGLFAEFAKNYMRDPRFEDMMTLTALDPEKVILDAAITHAVCYPTPNSRQDLDFAPNVSSVGLSNAASIGFRLHVKSNTEEAVYARASVFIYAE